MPTNTRFRIEAHLTRPAYLHLFWIDTQGSFYPLHGWVKDTWQPLPSLAVASSLLVPADDPVQGPQWLPLEGPAGTETVVLLARTVPLDRPQESQLPQMGGALETRLREAAQKMPSDPARAHEFTYRQEEIVNRTRGPGKPVPVSDDPLALLQLLLRDHLGPYFTLVRALSFANRGR
jgi:hypothetical protein